MTRGQAQSGRYNLDETYSGSTSPTCGAKPLNSGTVTMASYSVHYTIHTAHVLATYLSMVVVCFRDNRVPPAVCHFQAWSFAKGGHVVTGDPQPACPETSSGTRRAGCERKRAPTPLRNTFYSYEYNTIDETPVHRFAGLL